MKNIYTNTHATFTTADGETVSYQEIFESVRTNVEIYGRNGGRDLSAEELEDLFQDSILRALKYCKSFDFSKARPKTWAGKIAFNTQRDAYKAHNRQIATYVPEESFSNRLSGGYQADREVEGNEAMRRIRKAISSLSENHRFIISLQLEGMKPRKMAELIGCSADAAATLLCRARKALKKLLGPRFLAEYGITA